MPSLPIKLIATPLAVLLAGCLTAGAALAAGPLSFAPASRRTVAAPPAEVALGALFAAKQAQSSTRSSALHPKISNGLPTQDYPSAGYLLIDIPGGTAFCSGVLIGCSTFATAAHCVCVDANGDTTTGAVCAGRPDLLDAAGKTVYLQNAGLYSVSKVSVNPTFNFGVQGDVALLTLSTPVTGVAPSAINTVSKVPGGTTGTIVGFGLSGDLSGFDVGIKRFGQVVTTTCSIVPGNAHVCWVYSDPLVLAGTDSDTCEGDSGGPLFVNLGTGPVLAGLTSGGDTNCVPQDDSFDSDIFSNRAWIQTAAAGDLGTASCGGLPAAGTPGATVFVGSGTLTSANPNPRFSLTVPTGIDLMRVTLNHSGETDGDLYIKHGQTATTSAFDCASTNSVEPEACTVTSPAAGTWSLLASRFDGDGDFQLTATLYASNNVPPTPCVPSATAMCLTGGRFKVEVDWRTPDGTTGQGQAIPLTSDSGYFWFFSANNIEMIVKVLDACSLSNHFWVFAGGLTNVQTTLKVTDSTTGVVKTYTNPQNTAFQPLQDTQAFTCP